MAGTVRRRAWAATVRRRLWTLLLATGLALALGTPARAVPIEGPASVAEARADGWVASWAAPATSTKADGNHPVEGDYTVRNYLRVSAGGAGVRVELSNRYGESPAEFGPVTIAPAGEPGRLSGEAAALTFGGQPTVSVPAGETVVSDRLDLPVPERGAFYADVHVSAVPAKPTVHDWAPSPPFVAGGDRTGNPTDEGFVASDQDHSVYYVTGLDVADSPSEPAGAIAVFGDSITDGVGSSAYASAAYPDVLADRLAADVDEPRRRPAVVNTGISGNGYLVGGGIAGRPGVERFAGDVLARTDVRAVILQGGGNDLRADRSADELRKGYSEVARQAKDAGLKVVGTTITPRGGSSWMTPEREANRVAFNDWVRADPDGLWDAVADFDAALRDPAAVENMRADYASEDLLHPNDAGHAAMAAAVDLEPLLP